MPTLLVTVWLRKELRKLSQGGMRDEEGREESTNRNKPNVTWSLGAVTFSPSPIYFLSTPVCSSARQSRKSQPTTVSSLAAAPTTRAARLCVVSLHLEASDGSTPSPRK